MKKRDNKRQGQDTIMATQDRGSNTVATVETSAVGLGKQRTCACGRPFKPPAKAPDRTICARCWLNERAPDSDTRDAPGTGTAAEAGSVADTRAWRALLDAGLSDDALAVAQGNAALRARAKPVNAADAAAGALPRKPRHKWVIRTKFYTPAEILALARSPLAQSVFSMLPDPQLPVDEGLRLEARPTPLALGSHRGGATAVTQGALPRVTPGPCSHCRRPGKRVHAQETWHAPAQWACSECYSGQVARSEYSEAKTHATPVPKAPCGKPPRVPPKAILAPWLEAISSLIGGKPGPEALAADANMRARYADVPGLLDELFAARAELIAERLAKGPMRPLTADALRARIQTRRRDERPDPSGKRTDRRPDAATMYLATQLAVGSASLGFADMSGDSAYDTQPNDVGDTTAPLTGIPELPRALAGAAFDDFSGEAYLPAAAPSAGFDHGGYEDALVARLDDAYALHEKRSDIHERLKSGAEVVEADWRELDKLTADASGEARSANAADEATETAENLASDLPRRVWLKREELLKARLYRDFATTSADFDAEINELVRLRVMSDPLFVRMLALELHPERQHGVRFWRIAMLAKFRKNAASLQPYRQRVRERLAESSGVRPGRPSKFREQLTEQYETARHELNRLIDVIGLPSVAKLDEAAADRFRKIPRLEPEDLRRPKRKASDLVRPRRRKRKVTDKPAQVAFTPDPAARAERRAKARANTARQMNERSAAQACA